MNRVGKAIGRRTRSILLIGLVAILLASCSQVAAQSERDTSSTLASMLPTSNSQIASPTTRNLEPTESRQPRLTETRAPTSTPSPTFDPKTIVTSTPFPPAECPEPDPSFLMPEFTEQQIENYLRNYELTEMILQLLSNGASFDQIRQLDKTYNLISVQDLTGDSNNELVVQMSVPIIIGCNKNSYEIILVPKCNCTGFGGHWINSVQDMNLNGVPEVIFEENAGAGGWTFVYIYEWNGFEFVSLLDMLDYPFLHPINDKSLSWYEEYASEMNGPAEIRIADIDGNGTKEIILKDRGQSHVSYWVDGGPWRGKQIIYEWNGVNFIYTNLMMDPPEYRFQVVQDADRMFLIGEYNKAIELYRRVIFDPDLAWWTDDWIRFNRESLYLPIDEPTPVLPVENTNEKPSLEAYSRYRLVLFWLAGGWVPDAQIVYDDLIARFPADSVGYPFAELANLLWDRYQETEDIAQSCQAVVDYAGSHPQIFDFLGNTYQGWQIHHYEPIDVCPYSDPLLAPPLPN